MNEIIIVPTEKDCEIEGYYYIPDYDVLPYENLSPSWYVRARRIFALHLAAQGKLKGVCTLRSILHNVMLPETLKENTYLLKLGDRLSEPEKLFTKLGYERVFNVREGGTFSIRGEIIDYLGPDGVPVRIELFGNVIEDIRKFNLKTQRSEESLQSVLLLPAREFILKEEYLKSSDEVLLEPIENQFTGKFVNGTILDYGVELYIKDKRGVLEHFIRFERELRKSMEDMGQDDRLRDYKHFGILDYETILSKVKELPSEKAHFVVKKVQEEEHVPSEPIISEEELQIGDIVVHKKYGIARFSEIKKVEVNGAQREFLVLNFADAVLYVPIEG